MLLAARDDEMEHRSGSIATFEALLRAFAEDPTDRGTSDELAELADEIDRWSELLDTCGGWLDDGRLSRSARLSLKLTLARWYADLDGDGQAFAYLNQILAEVPEHLGALEAMAAILERHGDDALLAQVQERIDEVRRALDDDDDDESEPVH